ncbi:uncharacterized protein V6R79_013359 [Siganus canaliculatus]
MYIFTGVPLAISTVAPISSTSDPTSISALFTTPATTTSAVTLAPTTAAGVSAATTTPTDTPVTTTPESPTTSTPTGTTVTTTPESPTTSTPTAPESPTTSTSTTPESPTTPTPTTPESPTTPTPTTPESPTTSTPTGTTVTTTPESPTTSTPTAPESPTTSTSTTPESPTTPTPTTPESPTTPTPTTPESPTTSTPTTPESPTTTTPTGTTATTRPTTSTPTTTSPSPPQTTTTSTASSTTSLACVNGELQNGVCLCPNEWTGETCSVVIGWFAYSEETCENGTTSAGKPKASVRCSRQDGQPGFEHPPQVLECNWTLSDIQQNLTSGADLEILASGAQILTSNPEELTPENVTTAAQIANTLLLSPNSSENVRVAAITTVSQLLDANTVDDSSENNATLGLTLTLEQLSQSQNIPQSQVVQPNLVVQATQIPAAGTQGVQFTALSGLSNSFTANRIQLNSNTSTIEMEQGVTPDALIHIQFPPEAAHTRQGASNVSLGFVLYQNDHFFRSKHFHKERVTVRVLSASVGDYESGIPPPHVEILFRPTSFRHTYEYADALSWISIIGLSVSILGLVVTIIHHIRDSVRRGSSGNKSVKLTQLFIYLSLLAFIITFVSGIENRSRPITIGNDQNIILTEEEHVEPDRGSCTAVAALLQFFLLATFMWNSIYASGLALVLKTVRMSLPPHWTKGSMAVGWGVPAIVMVITLAVAYQVDEPLGYRQEEFCWLAAVDKDKYFDYTKPMFWGFILPLGLILVYNVVLLVVISLTMCRTNPQLKSTKKSSFKKKFLISFSLAVILGVSWLVGYLVLLTSGHANLVFSIIFCLCTTTQGFLIFLLFTARTPSFKAAMSRSVRFVTTFQFSSRTYECYI